MATYYIDETTPAQGSRQMANINAGMDSMLQSLDRMQASRQRGRYYDYLNEIQKQKLGAAEAKDREDAHVQRALNSKMNRWFEGQRNQLIDARLSYSNPEKDGYLDKLDRAIGFARPMLRKGLTGEQLEEELARQQEENLGGEVYNPPWTPTKPSDTPSQRLAKYKAVIDDIRKNAKIEPGSPATEQLLRLEELYNYANAAVNLATSTEQSLRDPKVSTWVMPFVNKDGITDYQFYPSRDQKKFFKTQYGFSPFKGTRIEPGSVDAADAATYGQDRAVSPRSLPGGPLIGQEGYVTPLGPESAQTEPRLMKMDRPDPSAAAPVPPQPTIFTDSVVADVEPEEAPPSLSEFAVRPAEPAIFSKEWEENYERERNHRYYRNKLSETDAEIARVTRALEGVESSPALTGRAAFSAAQRRRNLKSALQEALEDREKYKGLVEYTAPPQPEVFYQPVPAEDQPVPVEDQPVETLPPNPYTEDITSIWMPDEIRNRKPAVEGNRPMRLDQLQQPVSDVSGIPDMQPDPRPVVDGNMLMRLDEMPAPNYGGVGPVSPSPAALPPSPDEPPVVESGGYTIEDWLRDNPDMGYELPPSGERLMDLQQAKAMPLRPMIDRSFPEMGPLPYLNDSPIPQPVGERTTELNTFGGPAYIRRLLGTPVEPVDFEPYPGNPNYLPGGALYEEEE
tara:strand:+ start:7347 stop:9383 length:2037 start_codon:yes stop_codon:yes gene_type:complete